MRVQCQETRRFLDDANLVAPGIWSCPHCAEREVYLRAEVWSPQIVATVERAIVLARSIFSKRDDGLATRVLLGNRPESVVEGAERAVHIYLARDSDWEQFNYSGAHEAFHRVCSSNGSAGHWIDEMLAVMFSLRYLREVGLERHAERNEKALRMEADKCGLLLALANRGSYAEGFLGRCLLIGEKLVEAVGWEQVARLTDHYERDGTPSFESWLTGLPEGARSKAMEVLGS